MSEPRLTIQNVATNHLLFHDDSFAAMTALADNAENRMGLFKVQWCEQISDKIAKTVLIRTDLHPQSLLDVRDLCFQGSALSPRKCYDQNRWWRLIWLEIVEAGVTTVLFKSHTRGTYLAEKESGAGVEVMQISGNISLRDIPPRAKWRLSISGRAFRPGKKGVVPLRYPIATVLSAFPGVDTFPETYDPMAAAFSASGATTLSEAEGTTSALSAGSVARGISAAAATLLHETIKDVSIALFVDW